MRFRRRRAVLRRILGQYLGEDPAALDIVTDATGKPRLRQVAVRFNMSASGDWVAVAMAQSIDLGIDIEAIRAVPDALSIASRFFHPAEAAALQRVKPYARDTAFLNCWVRKEAVAKADGAGLRVGLATINAGVDRLPPDGLHCWLGGREFVLRDLTCDDVLVAAVAVGGTHFRVIYQPAPPGV